MGWRFDTFADEQTGLTDEADIWRHTATNTRNIGFIGCHLTMIKRTKAGLMNDRLLTDFPNEFERAYRHRGLVDIDPFLLFGCETLSAKKIVTHELHLAGVVAYEHICANSVPAICKPCLLSPRERECLCWLCPGIRVSMIADKLLISESAVNLYVSNAKRKLNAKTREQAVAKAL